MKPGVVTQQFNQPCSKAEKRGHTFVGFYETQVAIERVNQSKTHAESGQERDGTKRQDHVLNAPRRMRVGAVTRTAKEKTRIVCGG